jgi:uncharacterized OsmC-like protein
MSMDSVSVELRQAQDYRFEVSFGGDVPALLCDEPAPLGSGTGPSPVQLLCAAVGNCLSDSLLFALRKFKQVPEPLHCVVKAEVGRNEQGRLRVLSMQARLQLGVPATALEHLQRVLDQFESYCTVTQSVGQGFPVEVQVWDAEQVRLK